MNSELAHLCTVSQLAIINSVAPSTQSTYLTGWRSFKAFLLLHNLPATAFDLSTICSFITFSHRSKRIRATTAQTYLAGINFIYKLASGNDCPSLSHPHISMLLKGLQKNEPRTLSRRSPLTSDLLTRCIYILRAGYISPPIDRTLECMFLLAFFGFLRCSEFAPTSSRFNPSLHPRLADLSIVSSDTLCYTLRRSKTDQTGVSCPIYLFKLNSVISPYEPLTSYLSDRYASYSSSFDPLFVTESGNVATRFWFSQHFKTILGLSGISPLHFSIHSFRIGAASTAARAGVPEHQIQILGRWSSRAYHTYIRHNVNDLRQAHSFICN